VQGEAGFQKRIHMAICDRTLKIMLENNREQKYNGVITKG
jgi:hypothetical protein